MMVAWHRRNLGIRPVGYGLTGLRGGGIIRHMITGPVRRIIPPLRGGTTSSRFPRHFVPGYFHLSLRDGPTRVYSSNEHERLRPARCCAGE